MSGHSKWSQIKRKKAVTDTKRGKMYTKLLREIQIASKLGGSSPEGNARLKTAIQAAKALSVPADNIERATKRGSGETEGVVYEEMSYEGYGPGGVAVIVKAYTDNKNRTVADVRHAFGKFNGSLGGANSVAFQFEEKGILYIPQKDIQEDVLMEKALNAGAQDIVDAGDEWEIVSAARDFHTLRDTLEKLVSHIHGEIRMVPQVTVMVKGDDASNILKMIDALDDLDDVQNVYANFEIDEKEMEALN